MRTRLAKISLTGMAIMFSHGLSFADQTTKSETGFTSSILDEQLDKLSGLTEAERKKARQWNLTDKDWVKYKEIMDGPRGVWSPGLDPITALGVSETDPAERKRYAIIWLEIEAKRNELEFAFEREHQKQAAIMFKGQERFSTVEDLKQWEEEQSKPLFNTRVFMDAKCLEECEEMFATLNRSIGSRNKVDIFFVGTTNSTDIGNWAKYMKIPVDRVKSREITLNFDEGQSFKDGIEADELPAVIRIELANGEQIRTW